MPRAKVCDFCGAAVPRGGKQAEGGCGCSANRSGRTRLFETDAERVADWRLRQKRQELQATDAQATAAVTRHLQNVVAMLETVPEVRALTIAAGPHSVARAIGLNDVRGWVRQITEALHRHDHEAARRDRARAELKGLPQPRGSGQSQ
jgi:hypothetical protein